MKPTPSDQVSEKRSAYKAGDRVRVQWSQRTQRIVSLHPHAAYAVFESDVTGSRREAPLFDITGLVVSVINPGAQPAPVPSPEIKVGDWVRLKAQPDRDGIVIEIRESGTIVVLELVQRKASRPFDAVALQAWSSAVEHVPVKPGPTVYPHGMGAKPAPALDVGRCTAGPCTTTRIWLVVARWHLRREWLARLVEASR